MDGLSEIIEQMNDISDRTAMTVEDQSASTRDASSVLGEARPLLADLTAEIETLREAVQEISGTTPEPIDGFRRLDAA